MDVVLGVSMSPSTIRTVLVEGESADCVTVEAHDLEVAPADESVTTAVDQVVTAVLDARAGADEAGDQLCSTGVTWTDEVEVAGLRAALAEHKVHNVMLVSAFLAAAALAQAVGQVIGYGRIAMLFLEPECATLAVVDAADGSISDVHKELLHSADATAEVIEMVAGLESLETCPAGLFVVGSGVDVAPIKSRLETETSLAVTTPEEPETALARGAALASANAPLFASSTAALAYAQDPGTGEVDLDAVAPGYFYVPDAPSGGEPGEEELAYSALPDEEADALTEVMDTAQGDSPNESERRRRPVLLLGSAGAVVAISAVVAMEVALALGIRPGVALRPSPGHNLIVPAQPAPAPAGPQPRNIPQPSAVAVPHPLNPPAPGAPPPAAPAPAPVPAAPPVPVLVPLPAVPVPDSPPAPLNLPARQPPMQVPASPPTQVPVSPPTHVPVSHPPVHVPEPQPPVNLPSPDGPPSPGHPGHEAPPVPGLPGLEPPAAPGIPGHEAPPAPDTPPARGDGGGPGGGPGEVGGHGSGGGADEGGAGTGSHGSSGGGEIGGGSIGGGSPSGGETGGGSSGGGSGGGSSSGGGAEIGGGSSGSGSSSGGSSSESGGSFSGGASSGESGGGGHR
jgi:hypothetical protein